jgi:hypothetical protein
MASDLLRIWPDLGRELGISRSKAYELVASGLLPAVQLGPRFIETVALVRVSVGHTDPIIYERILVERPEILSEFLQGQPDPSGFDSVALVSLVIGAVDWKRVSNDTALGFANRTLGAVRNELQRVVQALSRLAEIVRLLGDDIDESMVGPAGRERNVANDWFHPFEGSHG